MNNVEKTTPFHSPSPRANDYAGRVGEADGRARMESMEGNFLGLADVDGPGDVAILPVPYELTTSYGEGTVDGPQACIAASSQVELYDPLLPEDLPAAIAEVTGGEGFDFTMECIGMPSTMRQAFDMTRRGGTCCIVGVGRAEETFELSAFEMFFSEKTLIGSMYGSADVRTDFNRFLRLYKAGRLDLDGMITRRIRIDEINDAMACMGDADVIRQVIDF